MKERPILFSGPMVRALLAGKKTQTRRVVSATDWHNAGVAYHAQGIVVDETARTVRWYDNDGGHDIRYPVCHYGQPGDRLWVKETHRFLREALGLAVPQTSVSCQYRASEDVCDWSHWKVVASAQDSRLPNGWSKMDKRIGEMRGFTVPVPVAWRPSIFMSRWASRITLEIVSVRVERLNDISVPDAMAEGISHSTLNDPRVEYQWLWESINGAGSWAANPWVWVIEFRRINS